MNDLTFSERERLSAEPQAGSRESPLDFLEYWRNIARHKWSILALTLLVGLLATLVVFAMRPTYRSTATLMIEQGKSKVVSIEEVYSQGFGNREYYQTQVEILRSAELARRVVKKLELTRHPDFDPRAKEKSDSSFSWLPWAAPKDPVGPSEEDVAKRVLYEFRENLQVQPVRSSQLVQVSFTSYDRELAARVPNVLAELYIESDLEQRVAMTQKASAWLTERMGDLRKKLDASERQLQDYRERERIVDAKGVSLSGASKQLEEVSKNLVEQRQKRSEAENLYNQIQAARGGRSGNSLDSLPAVLRHPLVIKLKEAEADAERKVSEAKQRYGAEHPKMIAAESELRAARENSRRQVELVVSGITKEYEAAKANEQAVERALGQSKADIASLNRKEFQLGVLEREAQANRQLYDMFGTRFKETNVAGDLQNTVARVIDPATVGPVPFGPKKTQIVLVSMALALVIGGMLALLLERMNNTLNSTADVELRLGTPALGFLQKVKGFDKKGFASQLAFFNDSQSVFAEAIRTIRTGVLMSAVDKAHKVIVVTSAVPEEGKTTVSFNLACALGQIHKVLLVDADLRRPKIGRLVGRDAKAPGLSDMVAGTAQAAQCIYLDDRAGIHILTAGGIPPNPLELLSSKRFQDMLAKLRETFDIVVIDSAPLQLVSDALVLSQHADAVIYVVKANSTPYQMAQNGIRRLRKAEAPVLGVVLNQLDLERAERYYGEYSGYKSYRKYGYKTD